jgi:hypothetical protein
MIVMNVVAEKKEVHGQYLWTTTITFGEAASVVHKNFISIGIGITSGCSPQTLANTLREAAGRIETLDNTRILEN